VALEKAQSESETFEGQLADARGKVSALQAKLAERQQLEEAIRKLQADQAEAKAENPRLRDEMHELKDRIDTLSVADGAECPLCGQPLAEHDKEALVASLSQKGTGLGDRFRENKQLLENFESQLRQMGAQLADLKGVDAELREATRRADQLTHQLDSLQEQKSQWTQTGAARLVEIGEILEKEGFAEEARQKLAEIDKELAALGYDLAAHEQLRRAEQVGREADAELRALEKARAALEPIEREIAGLEAQLVEQEQDVQQMTGAHSDAAAAFAAAQAELPDIREAEKTLLDSQEQENLLRREVGAAEQLVNVLATQRERKAELTADREALTARDRRDDQRTSFPAFQWADEFPL
jgi:exonuclease SbcC